MLLPIRYIRRTLAVALLPAAAITAPAPAPGRGEGGGGGPQQAQDG